MSKLCPDCGRQVDKSVSGTATCTNCSTVFVTLAEGATEWTVEKAPDQWRVDG